MLLKQIAAIVLTAIMAVTLTSCENNKKTDETTTWIYSKEFIWPPIGLAQLLPVPESNIGEILENDSTCFYVDVDRLSKEHFESYLKKCEEEGFVFDHSEYNGTFYVFYKEEYELEVFYQDALLSIIITKLDDQQH